MSKLDGCTISIENWDKYNPRKDLKATNWLRLQNGLFEDPNFFEFNHSELLFWVYVLSIASKKQAGEIRLSIEHARRIGRFDLKTIESAIQKLEELQCVRITIKPRYVDVTRTSRARHTTNERTNETNVTNETLPTSHVHDTYTTHAATNANDRENETLPAGVNPSPKLNAEVWNAYRDEYANRYKVEPTRNATVNAQISQLGKRLGQDAAEVVKFYVRHNDGYFIREHHSIGICLAKAESLHSQWKRNLPVTSLDVKRAESALGSMQTMALLERGEL
jgi:hypothetical protein